MSRELFQIRKRLVNLKKDTRLAVEQYGRIPAAQRIKALRDLERGFRQDAAQSGVKASEIDAAANAIFRPAPVEDDEVVE